MYDVKKYQNEHESLIFYDKYDKTLSLIKLSLVKKWQMMRANIKNVKKDITTSIAIQ